MQTLARTSAHDPWTAACPRDPWTAEVQSYVDRLRREVSRKELQHREALEALEAACDQRDEARRQSDYWMKLARSEAERADQCQPLTAGERRWWSIAGMLGMIGAGVVLGMQVGGRLW